MRIGNDFSSSDPRVRKKKRKRLDAICDDTFVRERGLVDDHSELRRSGRIRRQPLILDASPTPVRKRSKTKDLPGWKARLRSTARNMDAGREHREHSRGKMKLLFEEGTDEVGENSQGKPPYSDHSEHQEEEAETPYDENVTSKVEMAVLVDDTETGLHLTEEDGSVNGVGTLYTDSCNYINEKEVPLVPQLDKPYSASGCVETDKRSNIQLESDEVGGVFISKSGSRKFIVEEDKTDENTGNEHVPKTANIKTVSLNLHRKSYPKEGRRCGLCGVGTDGRPPKILVQDSADSEDEACSEFSASEEPNYDIWDGFGDEPGWLGRLLGPIDDRFGITGTWVHQHCAVWSPEVYFAGLGCLKNVRAALCRGRALKCVRCGRRGATIGCRVDRCPKTYHLPCARATGCIFDHRKFLVACPEHRRIFQAQGYQYLCQIRKMKAKKMKLELRKTSMEASRKDFEAEEKWMEKCGEDEEFVKREKKRLQRDFQRIAPVYIGGGDTASDEEKIFQGWESVAGLEDVVRCMKEVVILPLLYPEFFANLGLTPPRGVLLHGYPGTGKTLVVRALIGSCARGDNRIAYFSRKGADCLGKYVGDAERQLRLLFQVAERSQPSIIFFDEIDGLAPCRTRKLDQTQSSVVSTLLALMDGLNSRGSVIVIGATNRPDSVDPALRRPGRFDREIYFPLPSTEARSAILSLHTQNWPKPVAGPLLKWISTRTAGFAGADLQALCTQAAMIALKRHCPLQELLSAVGKSSSIACRAPLPTFVVQERDWLEALSCAPPPCSRREAGMPANDVICSPLSAHLIPCLLQPLSKLLVSLYLDEHLCLPAPLLRAAKIIESVVVLTLDRRKMPCNSWWTEVDRLLQDDDFVQELVKKLSSVSEICTGPNVLAYNYDDSGAFENLKPQFTCRSAVAHSSVHGARNEKGFRIMISGSPRSGHQLLASCLLNSFVGNIGICKVDMATMAQEGHGDLLQGLTEILKKCSTANSCVLFLPRVELWASEKLYLEHEVNDSIMNSQSPEKFIVDNGSQSSLIGLEEKLQDPLMTALCASHLWNSFIEQVDTICISTTLMILSTSEVPYASLPLRTRQFFGGGQLKWQNPMSSVYRTPRFVVQNDGKFNHSIVISSAAAKLSRDVVQIFVQLIYNRIHSETIQCEGYEPCSILDCNTGRITGSASHQIASDHSDKTQASEESKNLPDPVIRNFKGKSNLLLAISTFGYQILRYPHFAELNWVTSKLKDGPFADASGPWKAWPFNSCIVRPNNSIENIAVASSPNTTAKRSENCSLVRGLTAVGLSAYRGLYSSTREVTEDVRKVLELIVKLVSFKINSGKDKSQFIRLLSQVAYLEDIVTNWAHALNSLECTSQLATETHELGATLPSEDHATNLDNKLQSEVNGESVGPVVSSHYGSPNLSDYIDLNSEEVVEGGYDISGQESFVLSDHSRRSDPGVHPLITIANAVNLDRDVLGKQYLDDPTLHEPENMVKRIVSYGNVNPLTHSNGFLTAIPDALPNKSFQSAMPNDTEFKTSGDKSVDSELSGIKLTLPAQNVSAARKEGAVCLYNCCCKCLHRLYGLMQKLMMHKWEESGGNWTVEDFDDIVGSISVNLMSDFRSKYNAEHSNKLFEKISKFSQKGNKSGCDSADCKIFVPRECVCCNDDGASQGICSQTPLGMKFMYQDGVLLPVDADKDVSCHCKFSTLCLCFLLEWAMEMTKKV
uniref:PHD-type domain-containing protein n=1 Tax=Kalanchoe fedtschenkoi TaxID=63787 RepID=A0A7N0V6H7_KALFE